MHALHERYITEGIQEMKKTALFVFNGDPMCFIHVLLNALDMEKNGYDVKIIIEGSATKLIPEIAKKENPLFKLYLQAKGKNLIDGVCRACSTKMGVASSVEKEGLPFLDEMSGHPGIAHYEKNGFQIITF
jgi:hypothetical protein